MLGSNRAVTLIVIYNSNIKLFKICKNLYKIDIFLVYKVIFYIYIKSKIEKEKNCLQMLILFHDNDSMILNNTISTYN